MAGSVQTYKTGKMGEVVAALYLTVKGYRIKKHRAKTPVGEVDLIACRGRTLVFVEVKVRQNGDDAVSCVTPAMRRRITRAAEYMCQNPAYALYEDRRIDVIAISWPFFIRHIVNAW